MEFLINYGKYFGMAGCIIVTLGIGYAALAYRGKRQERFSLLNHFISELGEIGVSKAAAVFNSGLILGGLLLLPFLTGLGLAIDTLWGKLGLAAGAWAGISVALVGVFPMNNLSSHGKAATSYFRGGLATVVLFSIAIQFQPAGGEIITRWANLIGLLSAAAYASFLILLGRKTTGAELDNNLNPGLKPDRPTFWLLPAVEWAVFFSTILWFFAVALLMQG